MTIARDYVDLVDRIAATVPLPTVRALHVAPHETDPHKSSKFGALELDDGTIGLTYTGLDNALAALQDNASIGPLIGGSPLRAAELFLGSEPWQRVVGMAAINAVSQYLWRDTELPASGSTLDLLDVSHHDHVGMIGYFPPLVEGLRHKGVNLTVVELDSRWQQHASGFEVTLDASRLRHCNKILSTGTVMINHTLEAMLTHCCNARAVALVGPTLGCLPDPLFDRGVTLAGGCKVLDRSLFLDRWRRQDRWRASTVRYIHDAATYAGYQSFLRPTVES